MDRTEPNLRSVSIEFECVRYQASYIKQSGLVTVVWYNPNDFKRHQLTRVSDDPYIDAPMLLQMMLLAAKFRGEL